MIYTILGVPYYDLYYFAGVPYYNCSITYPKTYSNELRPLY